MFPLMSSFSSSNLGGGVSQTDRQTDIAESYAESLHAAARLKSLFSKPGQCVCFLFQFSCCHHCGWQQHNTDLLTEWELGWNSLMQLSVSVMRGQNDQNLRSWWAERIDALNIIHVLGRGGFGPANQKLHAMGIAPQSVFCKETKSLKTSSDQYSTSGKKEGTSTKQQPTSSGIDRGYFGVQATVLREQCK